MLYIHIHILFIVVDLRSYDSPRLLNSFWVSLVDGSLEGRHVTACRQKDLFSLLFVKYSLLTNLLVFGIPFPLFLLRIMVSFIHVLDSFKVHVQMIWRYLLYEIWNKSSNSPILRLPLFRYSTRFVRGMDEAICTGAGDGGGTTGGGRVGWGAVRGWHGSEDGVGSKNKSWHYSFKGSAQSAH